MNPVNEIKAKLQAAQAINDYEIKSALLDEAIKLFDTNTEKDGVIYQKRAAAGRGRILEVIEYKTPKSEKKWKKNPNRFCIYRIQGRKGQQDVSLVYEKDAKYGARFTFWPSGVSVGRETMIENWARETIVLMKERGIKRMKSRLREELAEAITRQSKNIAMERNGKIRARLRGVKK